MRETKRFLRRERSVASWITIGTPSRDSLTSSSIPAAPSRSARANAARVFSGATAEAPRWQMMSGDLLVVTKEGNRNAGLVRLRISHSFEFDIKRAEIDLHLSSYRQMTFVLGYPDC